MSGHSHARTVRHQKEASALKRGQVFSKMIRMISIAVREAGPDPETNSKLKMVIDKAKGFNMPKDNIEKAIEKAKGGGEIENLEEVIFEAYGPGGIAIIIEGITDNKNRTLNSIKQILNQGAGKLVQEGAVRWMFDRKGCIMVDLKMQEENAAEKEKLELMAIESGAEDIRWNGDVLDIYTRPEGIESVKKALEAKGIKIESSSLDWTPKEEIVLGETDKSSAQKLFDLLDDNDDVQDVYSNLKE